MSAVFDQAAPKKSANLRINGDLLSKAKVLNINLSATFESALTDVVREKERQNWKTQNKPGIAAYNKYIETHGLFKVTHRKF